MEKPVLFINACVRADSRTERLAYRLLEKLEKPCEEVRLEEIAFPVADEAFLQRRDRLVSEGKLGNPMFDLARQFAAAEEIVIAAPYWDLSFPAVLKIYMELVCAVGVTFDYSPQGRPVSLCNAKKLVYVTTAGGYISPADHGFGYIKELGETFFGIPDIRCIKAEGLDIEGSDPEKLIMEAAEQNES